MLIKVANVKEDVWSCSNSCLRQNHKFDVRGLQTIEFNQRLHRLHNAFIAWADFKEKLFSNCVCEFNFGNSFVVDTCWNWFSSGRSWCFWSQNKQPWVKKSVWVGINCIHNNSFLLGIVSFSMNLNVIDWIWNHIKFVHNGPLRQVYVLWLAHVQLYWSCIFCWKCNAQRILYTCFGLGIQTAERSNFNFDWC